MTPLTMKNEDLRKLSKAELQQLLTDIDGTKPTSIHNGYLLGRLAYRIQAVMLQRELA